jgi:hypothetical protein
LAVAAEASHARPATAAANTRDRRQGGGGSYGGGQPAQLGPAQQRSVDFAALLSRLKSEVSSYADEDEGDLFRTCRTTAAGSDCSG